MPKIMVIPSQSPLRKQPHIILYWISSDIIQNVTMTKEVANLSLKRRILMRKIRKTKGCLGIIKSFQDVAMLKGI